MLYVIYMNIHQETVLSSVLESECLPDSDFCLPHSNERCDLEKVIYDIGIWQEHVRPIFAVRIKRQNTLRVLSRGTCGMLVSTILGC